MMTQILKRLWGPLIGAWVVGLLVVDFVIAPTIFQTVPNRALAGNLAMILFKKWNLIEMVCAILLGLLFFIPKRRSWIHLLASLITIMATFWEGLYLIPKLSTIALGIYEATNSGIENLEQEMAIYHQHYVWLDSGKLLFLLILLGLYLFSKEKGSSK